MGAVSQEFRCFVGGLPWSTTDEGLHSKFSEYGRIVDAKVICDKETRRSRGFGFVTFADEQAMEEAIERQHDKEFDGRVISVSRARPKTDDRREDFDRDDREFDRYERHRDHDHAHDHDRDRDRWPVSGPGSCFRCGKAGHWARECPLAQPPPLRFPSSYGRDNSYRDRGRDRYADRDRDYPYGPADRYDDGAYVRERYRDREGRGGPMRYDRDRDRLGGPYDRPAFNQYRPYHDRSRY